MTQTIDERQVGVPASAPSPEPSPPNRPAPRAAGAARTAALSLTLLVVFCLGFLLYLFGLSGLQEHRSQDTMYASFRPALAKAIAPVSAPIREGASVAVLSVPYLGVRQVVVEGTASSDLMRGPGHRRDTVLPGQPGVSVVLGRRATFGSPFAQLNRLQSGDLIQVVTGLGAANYRVLSVRDSNAAFAAKQPANRLVLVTSDPPWKATRSLIVTAELMTPPFPASTGVSPVRADEQPLAGERSALLALVLWGQVLLVVVGLTVAAYSRWRHWTAYLISTPVIVAVLWNVYENLARLLPNTL